MGNAGHIFPYTAADMCVDTDAGNSNYGTKVNLYYSKSGCTPWAAYNGEANKQLGNVISLREASGLQWKAETKAGNVISTSEGSDLQWNCPNAQVGQFRLNYDKSKCIDIALNGASGPFNGAALQIWGCNGGLNQNFIWCSDGRIVSALNKKFCIDVPGGNPHSSTNLWMWTCDGRANQKWSMNGPHISPYTAHDMCVDTDAGNSNYGTKVNLYYSRPGCTPWATYNGEANKQLGNVISNREADAQVGNSSATDRVDLVIV